MILAIPFSLKTMESLQNGVATNFPVTPLFSMRTESQVSLQSCRSVDDDAWCKRTLIFSLFVGTCKCLVDTKCLLSIEIVQILHI